MKVNIKIEESLQRISIIMPTMLVRDKTITN